MQASKKQPCPRGRLAWTSVLPLDSAPPGARLAKRTRELLLWDRDSRRSGLSAPPRPLAVVAEGAAAPEAASAASDASAPEPSSGSSELSAVREAVRAGLLSEMLLGEAAAGGSRELLLVRVSSAGLGRGLDCWP